MQATTRWNSAVRLTKTSSLAGLALCAALIARAQPAPPGAGQTNLPPDTDYAPVSVSANSRVMQRVTYQLGPSGQVVSRVHSYTELATGLNHLVNGAWVPSSDQISLTPSGPAAAAATNGQHQVFFPEDIYEGVITCIASDGLQMQSRPLCIAYFDGTNRTLIGSLTNSVGQLLPSGNSVIYTNCFSDPDDSSFAADLLCTYRKSGFQADLIFRSRPVAPELLGLGSNVRIQLLTEFFGTPAPAQTSAVTNSVDGLSDSILDFGAIRMAWGKAFLVGDPAQSASAGLASTPVYKSWQIVDGRSFLVEELPYVRIQAQLNQLADLDKPARHFAATGSGGPSQRLRVWNSALPRFPASSKRAFMSSSPNTPIRQSPSRFRLAAVC